MKRSIHSFIILSVCLSFSSAISAEANSPVIVRKGETYELVLPPAIKKTLAQFNSRFKTWQATDYALEVRHGGHQEKFNNRAPFALITDINGDGITDLILDGHDDKKNLLLGIVSKASKYTVTVIRESDRGDPQTLNNEFEGKKQKGLAYYLWLEEKREPGMPLFSLAWPQQTSRSGKLLGDGGVVQYHFKNGKFEEEIIEM